ncbi:MAG: ABC transporter permease [Chloroflexota bacterium]
MISNIFGFVIRTSAFLRKEMVEILRQPRLILTLVLGPFLILLLFGIGYRVEAQPIEALFVVQPDNPFLNYLEDYTTDVNPLLHFAGVSDSLPEAQAELRDGEVDMIVVLPENPTARIRNSEQAVFELYHNEIDPFQIDYIEAFARIYIDEVNRRVLGAVAAEGQQEAGSVQDTIGATRQTATRMREAMEAGNSEEAIRERQRLAQNLDLLTLMLGSSTQLVAGMEEQFGEGESEAALVAQRLSEVREEVSALSELDPDQEDYSEEIEQARQIEEEFGELEDMLAEFRGVAPGVLVSPFRAEVQSISQAPLRLSDFYVPSAIALLAQHLAVTFAALSIVRERREGTIEVFQVSPLAPIEGLLGKYLSYFIFSTILMAILTALSVWGIQVPILGAWSSYALVLAALIFTSLGLGFVISLLANTTSQAVQYSMIILLASIFFSGFFLSLELLRPFVQVVSWLLPATYATQMLQDVMLRGVFTFDDTLLLLSLTVMGLALFVLAWLMLRRTMARR